MTTDEEYRHITPEDFRNLDHSTVTLLDLREPDEVLIHPVADAINIPFEDIGHISKALGNVPTDKPVVVFCRVGDWSEQVCEILADRGYQAINLDGGYAALRESVSKDKNASDGGSNAEASDTASSAVSSTSTTPAALAHPAQLLHVNAKGLKCPGPIVAVADALRDQPAGTKLAVEATEDAFCSDIDVWAARTGNRLVSINRDADGLIHAELEKGEAPSAPTVSANGAPATAGGDVLHDKTFVVFSGDLDKTIAVFIMANGAAAMGRKVTIFFTFWGLNILRRPKHVRTNKNLIERMFGFMMPRGTMKLGLSRMNMGGIGAKMIRWIMKSKNVASLEELMNQAKDHGVRLVACQMSMDIMGIRKEELIDGVELGGVSTFLGSGETSDMSLFV